jgi:hypothetical protein
MSTESIQAMIIIIEDQIDQILASLDADNLSEHELRARKKLARDLYFSIQYYDLGNNK